MTEQILRTHYPSKTPFIIIGTLQAATLAFISINSEILTNDTFFCLSSFIINFGLVFLLAYNPKSISKLIIIDVIYSLLATMVLYWSSKNNYNFFLFWLSMFSVYSSICFIQTRFDTNNWQLINNYPTLFKKSWDLICILFCITFFSLLAWLVLYVGAYLCFSIGINYFNYFISKSEFVSFITPIMAVTSLYLLMRHQNIIYFMRIVLLNFCLILLPALSLIGLIYFIALLWQIINHQINLTAINNSWVIAFIWLGILFTNAVYQDGKYQVKIRYYGTAVKILCVLMVLCSIENIYVFFNNPHTLTAFNLLTFITYSLLLAYSFFYTISNSGLTSMDSSLFEKTNIVLTIIIITIVLAIQNPLTQSLAFFSNMNDTSVHTEPAQIFKSDISKAGLKWDKNIKQSPILGYRDNSPLYACRASIIYKQKTTAIPGEINNLGECVFILDKKILKTNDYTVVNGKDKNITWQQFYNYGDSKLFPINFGTDEQKQLNICRGIYANNIYLGQMTQYEYRCQIAYENTIQELKLFEVLYATQ